MLNSLQRYQQPSPTFRYGLTIPIGFHSARLNIVSPIEMRNSKIEEVARHAMKIFYKDANVSKVILKNEKIEFTIDISDGRGYAFV